MATTPANNAVFVDTNILVYANLPTSPFSTLARTRLTEMESAGTELWISRQVIREYLVILSRPGTVTPPLAKDDLLADVERLLDGLVVADETSATTAQLLDLLAHAAVAGKHVHDANIVATMLEHGIPRLLTHNVADFRRFEPKIQIEPLLAQAAPT
jgi:predicted nucleic acid-binding protein